jgi:HEAT repeat protein
MASSSLARCGRRSLTPRRSRLLRVASVVLFALAVIVAAGAAAVGSLNAPVWLSVGAAVAAAVFGLLVPEADKALRKREAAHREETAAAAHLSQHLDSVRRRFEAHVGADNPFEISADRLIERRIRPRKPTAGDAQPLSDLAVALCDPGNPVRRLLLLGEGGAGKTTSLLRLAHDAAVQAEADPQAPIPIYVELSTFEVTERAFDRLVSMAANAMRGIDAVRFDQMWRLGTRPLLFLFDGLNEQRGAAVACNAGLRELSDREPHATVITSRPTAEADELAATDQKFGVADLLRLEPGQVERFLHDHGADRLFANMNDDLRDLSQNPFMLMALLSTSAGRPDGALPSNMGQLYRSFVDDYIYTRREPGRGHTRFSYAGVKKPRLAELANRMTSAGETVIADEGEPDDVESEIVANGVLRRTPGGVEFMHQSVQEYFTAVALESAPAEAAGRARQLVWRHVEVGRVGDARAEDPYRLPLLMLTGLLESSDSLVQALAGRDALLAAECLNAAASVAPSTRARLRDEWLGLLGRAHERYRRVGTACLVAARLSDDEIAHKLIDLAIDDPVYEVQRGARDALEVLGIGACAPYLAERVQQPGRYDTATELLARHAPEHAARVLLQDWLSDTSASGRERIEGALGLIDVALVSERVTALRGELNGDQAEAYAALLERLQASPGEKRRLPFASELREIMQKRAAEASEQISGTPTDELPDLLHGPDGWIRGAAATALAQRGQTAAVPALLDALARESPSSMASRELAAAVHQLGGDEVVPTLFSRIHENAPAELARVPGPWPGDLEEGAVPDALRDALHDAGLSDKFRATRADRGWTLELESSARDEAVVIQEHDDWLIAYRAKTGVRLLRALEFIVSPGSVLPELLDLLQHDDAEIRLGVLELLRGSRDVAVIDAIRTLLAHETSGRVIRTAGTTLAASGSPPALELLVDLVARSRLDYQVFGGVEQPERLDALLAERARGEQGPALTSLVGALALVRERQVDVARGLPEAHDEQRGLLIDVSLGEPDGNARRLAAEALRWSAGDPGIGELSAELQSEDPERRARSAAALGRIQDDAAAPPLDAALAAEPAAQARLAIAIALLELRADGRLRTAIHALVDLVVSDEDGERRRRANDALRQSKAPGAERALFNHLASLLDDGSDDALERAVARHLELFGTVEADAAMSHWLRGSSRERRGLFTLALEDYDAALEQYDSAALQASRAEVLAGLGRHADAVAAARSAVEKEATEPEYHANLGWYEYLAGELEGSIASSRKALELDPTIVNAAFNVGLAQLADAAVEEARASYAVGAEIVRGLPREKRLPVVEGARGDLRELREREPGLAGVVEEVEAELERQLTP